MFATKIAAEKTTTPSRAVANSIQPKLKVGKPDDKYEQEADQTAERIMSMPMSVSASNGGWGDNDENNNSKAVTPFQVSTIQRQIEEEEEPIQTKFIQLQIEEKDEPVQTKLIQLQSEEEEETVQSKPLSNKKKKSGLKYILNVNEPEGKPKEEVQTKSEGSEVRTQKSTTNFENTLSGSKSGGSVLPEGIRTSMESKFNVDFSGVKVHTDCTAVQMSNQINAQAFTSGNDIYFNQGKYNPNSREGQTLLAHELTHTIQQGASVQPKFFQARATSLKIQRSWLGDAWDTVSDVASSAVEFVSDGLEAGLNYIKNQFHGIVEKIPGYSLLSVVLGQDPVSGVSVDRSGRNFIEAGLDIIPFGNQFKQKLEETGAIEEAAIWLDNQIAGIEISLDSIKSSISDFWDSLSLTDVGDPSGVLERAADIIRRPISQIITFVGNVATEFLRIVKKYVLSNLVLFVKNNTRGYPLLTVILGKDPITEEPVERNGLNLIRGFMLLSADGVEQLRQMQETGTLQRAAEWIDTAVAELDLSWESIKNIFSNAWNLISIENLMSPIETFMQLAALFIEPVGRILRFLIKVGLKILEFIKNALLRRLSTFARQTRGYPLITVLLGKDPFTGELVERNAENIIRGFMSLKEGGEEQFQQMKETGAIQRTLSRIESAVERLGFTWEYITGLFLRLWNTFSLQDLAAPFEAFARIMGVFVAPIRRLFAFIWDVLKIVIEVLLTIMNFPIGLVRNIITKALQAIEDIKRDPIGFLKNILKAIKQGFVQFFENILKHLLSGVTGWLFGELKDAGINPPADFTFKSVLGFVLEVLGITMDRIWKKLAERIGQDKVDKIKGMMDKLEGIWTFVKDVATRGPIAIWEYIVEKLTNLWDTVLEAVRNWVITKIIQQVTVKLLSLLDPTGIMAVVNSVIAIYKAIQSFVRYLREMLEIVNSFVEGVAEIARGNIRTAANFIENAMHRSMPVIIGFLANQVGLGGIGKKVGEMIEKVREKVDTAIGWLVDKAVSAGTSFLKMLGKGAAAVKGGVAKLFQWWKKKKKFSVKGKEHSMSLVKKGKKPDLIIASKPKGIEDLIADKLKSANDIQEGHLLAAKKKKKELDTYIETNTVNKGGPNEKTIDLDKEIDKKLELIKTDLLTGGAIEAGLPLTNVTYSKQGNKAGKVKAYPLTKLPGNTKGSPPGGTIPGWAHIQTFDKASFTKRDGTKHSQPQFWRRFHLLNMKLHGPGVAWNMVPGHQDDNSKYEKDIERKLKGEVDAEKICFYEVWVDQWQAKKPEDPSDFRTDFPKKLAYKYGQLQEDPVKKGVFKEVGTPKEEPFNFEFDFEPEQAGDPVTIIVMKQGEPTLNQIGIAKNRALTISSLKGISNLDKLVDGLKGKYSGLESVIQALKEIKNVLGDFKDKDGIVVRKVHLFIKGDDMKSQLETKIKELEQNIGEISSSEFKKAIEDIGVPVAQIPSELASYGLTATKFNIYDWRKRGVPPDKAVKVRLWIESKKVT